MWKLIIGWKSRFRILQEKYNAAEDLNRRLREELALLSTAAVHGHQGNSLVPTDVLKRTVKLSEES